VKAQQNQEVKEHQEEQQRLEDLRKRLKFDT
jgi:hypothetical protein